MCGRYVISVDPAMLQQAFDLTSVPEFQPRFNIAPTQQIPVITNEARDEATMMRWGLIPSWAKDAKIGSSLINARSESVAEKPAFRAALKRRRCLVPATGFYEWKKDEDSKTPMYIQVKESPIFAMAGLWEVWREPSTGEIIKTYSILTTDANDFMSSIHTRMPVILSPEDFDLWLQKEEVSADLLKPLMKPYTAGVMQAYEVSKAVNRPMNDSPLLVEPIN